jgi:WD40 repeat protein
MSSLLQDLKAARLQARAASELAAAASSTESAPIPADQPPAVVAADAAAPTPAPVDVPAPLPPRAPATVAAVPLQPALSFESPNIELPSLGKWLGLLKEGLRPLAAALSDPSRSALSAAAAAPGEGASVALAAPVLAVRVASLDGPLHRDLRVLHPVVRVHLVDASTGAYLRPAGAAVGPAFPSRVTPPPAPTRDERWTSSMLRGQEPLPFSPSPASATSLPALNRALAPVATLLERAGVTHSALPAGASSTMGFSDGELLWGDTLVLGIPLSDAVSCATAVLLFEVLDPPAAGGAGGATPGSMRDADGNLCIAWGFLRLSASPGGSAALASGRVPLGITRALGPSPLHEAAGTVTRIQHVPLADVQLYAYEAISSSQRSAHLASVGASATAEVVLQYRTTASRRPLPVTLRLGAFGAIIPASRFIKRHEFGATHTLSVHGRGAAEGGEGGPTPLLQLHASAAELAQHPMLGRPRHLLRLPTDMDVDDVAMESGAGAAIDAANAAAAAAATAQASAAPVAGGNEADDDAEDLEYAPRGAALGLRPPKLRIPTFAELTVASACPSSIVGSLPSARQGTTALAFSPDGGLIAAACIGDNGAYPIRVFELGRGREIARLEGHGGLIYSLDWAPSGSALLSASGDGSACVWSLPRRSPTSIRLRGWPSLYSRLSHSPPAYVYAARFHPIDPNIVVTGSFDHSLRLWDSRLGEAASVPPALSPTAAAGTASTTLEGGWLGYIGGAMPVAGGSLMRQSTAFVGEGAGVHGGYVNCVEFDTPCSGLARRMLTADSTGAIFIWEMTAGHPSSPASYVLLKEMRPAALRGVPITSLRVRPGRPQVLVFGAANVLRLFDLVTFTAVRAYPNARCTTSRLEAAFSPDGSLIAAGSEDGELCVWEADSGSVVPARATTASGTPLLIGYSSLLLAVAWSPKAHVLALGAFGLEYPIMLCS